MKRSFVLLLGLVALAAVAAGVGFAVRSRKDTVVAGGAKRGAGGGTAGAMSAEEVKPTRQALPSDFERRRAAWLKQHPGEGDKAMTAQRLRRVQMSRFDLASLAQEAAMNAMGLAEGERGKLRQILADEHTAVLLRIEKSLPSGGGSETKANDTLADMEKQLTDPSTSDTHRKKMQEVLGEARLAELERLERRERNNLIVERRLYRKTTEAPAPSPAPAAWP
jgi:hypothetical protein